ncbi:membrane glycoprotein E3 CR1-gamma [Human mastadenovirus D]|uniref:Membrane glycoprotein E3 CR1-gamma n=1 Tax=Human mastadenovirus D TaxID=130310 RepID=A0A291B0J0_9ADEN|nr:membrane glycoprotein E3 CR1-gamma [Human mastadenovirus D]
MKAFTACVLISIVTLIAAAGYTQISIPRGGSITLNGTFKNTTWTRYHTNGWKKICEWNVTAYKCHNNGSITITATNITSGRYKADSYKKEIRTSFFRNNKTTFEDSGNYEQQKLTLFNLTIIEPPTTKAPTTTKPTTVRTTRETTTQPTTVPTTHPTTTASTTTETTTHTTQLDTTVQNSTVLVRYLLREESTTEQTEATSSAFSSTANLTSLASVNETVIALKLDQDRGLDMQITFLIVCGIFILAVLLYYVFCKARSKSHRTIYRPVIGDPQPLQVEGGLRNLLFSFSVW